MAPAVAVLTPGQGKAALARAPSLPLPNDIVARTKTGFGVPTGDWMAKSLDNLEGAGSGDVRPSGAEPKGLVSREWSRRVLPAVLASADNGRIDALASSPMWIRLATAPNIGCDISLCER